MKYMNGIHELRRVLEPIKKYEDMRQALRDLGDRGTASTIKYRNDAQRAINYANSELAKPDVSDFMRKNSESILSTYPAKLKKHEEALASFPVEALGEKATNLFTNVESRNRSITTAFKKTNGKDWESFGLKAQPKEGETKKPRGSERLKWERDTESDRLRTGGRETNVEKPEDMLKSFGLRGVEFGHWVDDASGKFHLKRSAEAFHDLADIIGTDDKNISFNGKLAMAFGARGKGGALAHYEPSSKVINMTKYGGAGSLAHEWGHGLDNIMYQYSHGGKGSLFLASNGEMGDKDPELKGLYDNLVTAIKKGNPNGPMRGTKSVQLDTTSKKNQFSSYYRKMRQQAQDGMSFEDMHKHWSKSINDDYDGQIKRLKSMSDYYGRGGGMEKAIDKAERKRAKDLKELPHRIASEQRYASKEWEAVKNHKGMVTPEMEAATHIIKKVNLPTDDSEYYARMQNADGGGKPYYSTNEEMFARVFESYIQDKLEKAGRKNSYLVSGTSEAHVKAMEAPFPHGDERQYLFKHMDALVNHIVKKGALEKALRLERLGGQKLVITL